MKPNKIELFRTTQTYEVTFNNDHYTVSVIDDFIEPEILIEDIDGNEVNVNDHEIIEGILDLLNSAYE